jgi:hypothetical protein
MCTQHRSVRASRALRLTSPIGFVLAATAGLTLLGPGHVSRVATQAQSPCGPTINAIACENQNPGNPASDWDVSGAGDLSIQGFATSMSVAPGEFARFKINTNASAYTIEIYRMGYYGGMGARRVATIAPSASLPQSQPACLTQSSSGLIDCGNWAVSASWAVPSTAVSGIYFARLERNDNGGASHIFFVVRNDARNAEVLFQTSDTTWQAYNQYGGNSLYVGGPGVNHSRAYKVSYNRPLTTRGTSPEDAVFNAEYPMVRFLEANGYDVSYISGVDADRSGALLLNHKTILSVGHDEYWSADQRANFEAARAAGVSLAFFSGNEVFWKTRWENSIDGSGTARRTLVCYKETHANTTIDPLTPTWTGTWADPRFSPPGDGGRPQNALTGQLFMVNAGDTTAITVPAALGKFRMWRNTTVATLPVNGTATFPTGTLGYEWDADIDNGFRPAGLMRLSQTTRNVSGMMLDYGSTYGPGTVTHAMTLYKHPSGALVFGAGTVQWSWGLDSKHDRGSAAPDVRMQQATVNLLADMGAQPGTLQSGLVPASASSDAVAPTSSIGAPLSGAAIEAGTPVTISGTAAENGGGLVSVVEVSTDGGTTWAPATGTTSWTYAWSATGNGNVTIKSRAYDDSGNREIPAAGVTVNITAGRTCPCSIIPATMTPQTLTDPDPKAVEVGMRFRTDIAGYVTGVRFYKGSTQNTGTHVGHLFTNSGVLLGATTFTSETASGWQQANFNPAIQVTANTTYVIAYHAPNGKYSTSTNFFVAAGIDNPPLHALRNGLDGQNGVYIYGPSGTFPTNSAQEFNWVDVVFDTVAPPDTTPPSVTSVVPANAAINVDHSIAITATFNEPMDPSTISSSTSGSESGDSTLGTFELRGPGGVLVQSTVTYDALSRTATLRPQSPLAVSTSYTALVKGGATDPRVKDTSSNPLQANVMWSFTTAAPPPPLPPCPCTIWAPTAIPNPPDDFDPASVELGTKFRSDVAGYITGARFYKNSANTGTHTASLWTRTGTRLALATFVNETASGWQQVDFASPVAITANTTYVISYHAPNGHYSAPDNYLAAAGVDNPPLHALRDGVDGPNGVYIYSAASTFPTETYQSEAYFVDVVFNTSIGPDVTAPRVAGVTPPDGATGVNPATAVTVVFNEAMDASTISGTTIQLRTPTGATVPASVTYNASTLTATLTPSSALAFSTVYTGLVAAGVRDTAGNATTADHTWSFTVSPPPPPPPTIGPGGPILVVTTTANPFSTYYAEILRGEGANAFATADLSQVTPTLLGGYDAVILGETPLTASQVTTFSNWVTGGGNLIAMRPDKQLAGLFGLTSVTGTLSNAYLQVDASTAPGAGIVSATMQFHGASDLYTLNGATQIARLFSTATASTPNPAVTLRRVGAGHAVAFTFDLAKSVVYTRQGNPAWSGQERDAQVPIRSDDLFFGARAGDVQPDWIDLTKVQIPQADEQQRLLWNIILHATVDRKPLPRFWYLPRMLKAAVVMTGDDHANNGTTGRFNDYLAFSAPGCNVDNWECVRGTSYLFPNTPISDAAVQAFVAQGFEIALHVNTNCADYTPSTLPGFYGTQLTQFALAWPNAPAPTTNRTHCIVWSDYATQAQVSLSHNIRLDTNYYYWPGSWVLDRPGMFTGSGMPQRFATATGQMIDVYQAATQMTDESAQTYPKNINTLLDNAIGPLGYYGAFTANMHTDFNPSPGQTGSNAIVLSAQARGIPVITARQLLDWVDGRNASLFQNITWNGNLLSFAIAPGARTTGLHAMVPSTFGSQNVSGISRDGVTVAFTLQTIKGVSYAVFAASTGAYLINYGADVTPPLITGVAASPSAASALITWATNEPSNSVVNFGTSPSELTGTVTDPAVVVNHAVTISGLVPNTTYYFRVSSTDANNNTATAPSAGPGSFTTNGLTLSGVITPAASGNGAQVTMVGPSNGATTVNATGNYSFGNLPAGSYTLTPSKTGHTFTPPSQTVTLTSANMTGVNFTAQEVVISGALTPGAMGAGATVNLTGAATATVAADGSGNFTFARVANGTYTVTPSKVGFIFTPANRSITVSNGVSMTGVNFTVQPVPTYSITGTITPVAVGNGATVTLSGAASATTTANGSGVYTFSGLANGNYVVTPSKAGATFTPTSRNVTVADANASGVDFTGVQSPAPTVEVTVFTDRSSSASTLASPAFSTTSGNQLLLAFIATDNVIATPTTVNSVTGGGLTWVLVRRTNVQRGTSEIWRTFAVSTVTNATVTATFNQSVPASITVMSFRGVALGGTNGSAAIGATASGSGPSGGPTATLVTTRANSIVIGVGNDWDNAIARTPGAGQTIVHQYLATVGDTFWVQRMTNPVAAAGTSVTINDTAPTGDQYNLTICEILAGG